MLGFEAFISGGQIPDKNTNAKTDSQARCITLFPL
tara:strand:- start:408 stop:512 length:105 start_codon:yes stop_codon:yes gene_type:complete